MGNIVDIEALGERLMRIRLAAGLSQQELAGLVGVSQASISSLERGKTRHPSVEHLARYMRACRARWGAIVDLLEVMNVPDIAVPRALAAGLEEGQRSAVAREARQEARRYKAALVYSRRHNPMGPGKLDRAAKRFGNYRVAVSIMEQEVRSVLQGKPVHPMDYGKYLAFARQVMSRLRKVNRPLSQMARLATAMTEKWGATGLDATVAGAVSRAVVRVFGRMVSPKLGTRTQTRRLRT